MNEKKRKTIETDTQKSHIIWDKPAKRWQPQKRPQLNKEKRWQNKNKKIYPEKWIKGQPQLKKNIQKKNIGSICPE